MTWSLTALHQKRLQGPTLGSQFCECKSVALFHTLSMHSCSKRECRCTLAGALVSAVFHDHGGELLVHGVFYAEAVGGCGSESAGNFKVTALGLHLGLLRSRGHVRIRCARSSNTIHQVLFHGGQSGAAS